MWIVELAPGLWIAEQDPRSALARKTTQRKHAQVFGWPHDAESILLRERIRSQYPGARIMPSGLVYLSCPYGGLEQNLHNALGALVWAQTHTPWGLWVQAPWIASAFAMLQRGTTEQWEEMGGIRVEERVLDGYDAVLHMGVDRPEDCSPGMHREARYMAARGGRVFHVQGGVVVETTELYR